MEEIKPCPFCGNEIIGLHVGIVGDDGEVGIWCNCGAGIMLDRSKFSDRFVNENLDAGELSFNIEGLEPIIKAWNRRSNDGERKES